MKPNNKTSLVTVNCQVLPDDFERTAYFFDSGMFDLSTKNPAAFALERQLKPGHKVRVCRRQKGGKYYCFIDGEGFPPSGDIGRLIDSAAHGNYLHGFEFRVALPPEVLR